MAQLMLTGRKLTGRFIVVFGKQQLLILCDSPSTQASIKLPSLFKIEKLRFSLYRCVVVVNVGGVVVDVVVALLVSSKNP